MPPIYNPQNNNTCANLSVKYSHLKFVDGFIKGFITGVISLIILYSYFK